MLLVLLPVRVLFVTYVSENWFGSFGMITLISVTIIILAKKGKLGWFGRAFQSEMFKVHKGKRRILVYTNLGIGLIFLTGTIYAIELGQTDFKQEVIVLKEQLPSEDLDQIIVEAQKEVRWTDYPQAFFLLIFSFILRFDIFAIIMTTLNDLSNGYVAHFATVFLVEELEIIGMMIYYKITIKNPIS